ncbi:MAG: aldose epimerase family protein, partial [Solirubrobacteraceae bacterium]
ANTPRQVERAAGGGKAGISSTPWGSVGGHAVKLYTLKSGHGMTVKITNYGGDVHSITVPSRAGALDVALGFPKLADYVADFTQGARKTTWPVSGGSGDTYFGAVIGRYGNRIANGRFSLNGKTYKLDRNNGSNALHGGFLGWNTHVWAATPSLGSVGPSLTLTATFPAGEGCLRSLSPGCTGFPAAMKATVTYTLTPSNQLQIAYSATNLSSTDSTVVNLTNHTYFNLAGQASGDVYDQLLALNSSQYQPTNAGQIPEKPYFVNVAGTPYDFRTMHAIGKYLYAANLPDGTSGPLRQLQIAHGYDNNWVLHSQGSYRLAAVAQDPGNGVTLRTYTDQPGVQLYTSNYLDGDLVGTTGKTYRQGAGFTLETQHYPDTPNHIGQPGWPSVVVAPGKTFSSRTAFAFSVSKRSLKGTNPFK